MASAKLQPLHNFSFTHLKWKNPRSGRSRGSGEASYSPSSPPRSSPWRESHNNASSPPHTSPPNVFRRPSPLHKQSPMRDLELEAPPSQFTGKTGKRTITESSTKSVDVDPKGKRSNKISIRIRDNSKQYDAVVVAAASSPPMDDSVQDESSSKSWNLRPRRPPMNHKQSSLKSRLQEIKPAHESKQSSELHANNNTETRRSTKQKFSIALTRGEIEDDIFLMTGSKPSRRPKKRRKAIQKQLDNVFPGLWLDSITADSYKVSEAPTKG